MTYKDILDSIEQVKAEKMTDKTASVLADLLFIKEHWCHTNHCDIMPEMVNEPVMDIAIAEEWCAHMENEDGTTGPHWSMERIRQEMSQRGICCDSVKFWAVINSIYSDDVAVAKKHGVNTMDYYIDRAKAWLDDKDAVKDKAAAYYCYVVKH